MFSQHGKFQHECVPRVHAQALVGEFENEPEFVFPDDAKPALERFMDTHGLMGEEVDLAHMYIVSETE